MSNLNTKELRKINKRNILEYVIRHDDCTKPEIAMDLKLSVPTVGEIINDLIKDCLLEISGSKASSGGRRAARVKALRNARFGVGIDITKQHINFVAVDLSGAKIASERIRKKFEDTPEFYSYIAEYRKSFCLRNGIPEDKILGVGVAVQGIISADQKYFSSHMVADRRRIPLFPFEAEHPYIFLNDGAAACMSECYSDNAPDDFVHLSLSMTVGGSVVQGKQLYQGMNLHSGEFGHMVLHPEGEDMCYCGRNGHAWCYVSVGPLEHFAQGSYHDFFARVISGEQKYVDRFEKYLDDLALLLNNIRAMYDSTIIIGGYIGQYLVDYMPQIRARVAQLDHLYAESKAEILPGQYFTDAAGIGAARYFTKKYIRELQ